VVVGAGDGEVAGAAAEGAVTGGGAMVEIFGKDT